MKQIREGSEHTCAPADASAQPDGPAPSPSDPPRGIGAWVIEPQPGLEFTFTLFAGGEAEVFDHDAWQSWLTEHDYDEPELRLLANLFYGEEACRAGYRSCLHRCRVPARVVEDVARTEAILQASAAARLPEALQQRLDFALSEVFWEQVNPHLDPPLDQQPLLCKQP